MSLCLEMNTRAHWIRRESRLGGQRAQALHDRPRAQALHDRPRAEALHDHPRAHRDRIEAAFRAAPEREAPAGRHGCPIAASLRGADPADWPRRHRRLVATSACLHDALRPAIAAMARNLSEPENPA